MNSGHIILTTERLNLRTWLDSDVTLMAAISSDPLVMEYFPSTQDIATTQKMIKHFGEHLQRYGYCIYAVELKSTKQFIGFVGLNQPSFQIPTLAPSQLPIVEIGWRLAAPHWQQGYATEAASAVLEYAFNTLNLQEIISFTALQNKRSRRVMEKIGLEHRLQDDFDHPNIDENHPLCRHVLYRLTKDEYRKRSPRK